MLGPVLGQLIYSGVGYAPTFYIFAGILTVALIVVMIIIPGHLNHVAFDDSKNASMVESDDGKVATFQPADGATTVH
jgi:hypothetical protein